MPGPPEVSPSAFDDLFRRDYPSIVRAVLPIVGDRQQAEAIAQDAFLAALRQWRRIRRYDRPGAWIRRVAIRDAVRFIRRENRSAQLDETTTPDDTLRDRDMAMDIGTAIRALPSQQRASVALFYFADWPTDEIADAMGCSASTVRVHLHRARRALATRLDASPEREEIA